MTNNDVLKKIANSIEQAIDSQDKERLAEVLGQYLDFYADSKEKDVETLLSGIKDELRADVYKHLRALPILFVQKVRELQAENKKLAEENRELSAELQVQSKSMRLLRTTLTDELSSMVGKTFDAVMGGSLCIETDKVKLTIGITELTKLPVNVDKLIKYCIATYTSNGQQQVAFSIKDYARLCGKNYDTSKQKKEFNKTLKKTLSELDIIRLKATSTYNAASIGLISGGWRIINGYVHVKLSDELCCYLKNNPLLATYNNNIWRIDGNHANDWAVASAMMNHYSQKNNTTKNTNNCLAVRTLLLKTNLPSIETVRAGNQRGWSRLILEPLEKILDDLIDLQVITEWHYTYAKREEIPFEILSKETSYEEWGKRYIVFEIDT